MLKFNIKTKHVKKLLSLIFVVNLGLSSFAQQDEQMSLYTYNPLYFNPAYAGSRDAISMVAVGRFQWVDFNGAPSSQWFSIHSPLLKKYLGIGGHFVNDRIGDRKRTSGYVDFSSNIVLNKKKHRLAAGISVGIDGMTYDFTQAQVTNPNDPFIGEVVSALKPNIGAGLYYYGEKFYVGISVPRFLQSKTFDVNNVLQLLNTRHYFITGGYVFDLNSVLKLKPSTLIKYTVGAPITVDANLSLFMYERITTGLMYRFNESMGANVAYAFKNLNIGYTYDFPINGLMRYQSGSHEVFLQYDLQPKQKYYSSPRYF